MCSSGQWFSSELSKTLRCFLGRDHSSALRKTWPERRLPSHAISTVHRFGWSGNGADHRENAIARGELRLPLLEPLSGGSPTNQRLPQRIQSAQVRNRALSFLSS